MVKVNLEKAGGGGGEFEGIVSTVIEWHHLSSEDFSRFGESFGKAVFRLEAAGGDVETLQVATSRGLGRVKLLSRLTMRTRKGLSPEDLLRMQEDQAWPI